MAPRLSPRALLFVCSVVLLGLVSPPLHAKPPTDSEQLQGEALFEAGLKRKQQGEDVVACELFEASVKLSPVPHAWLQVGSCREANDAAGALDAFDAALASADQVKDTSRRDAYRSAARDRIRRLSPRVANVSVRASPTPRSRVELSGPGRPAAALEAFGRMLRFNPGNYRVLVSATGYSPHHIDLELRPGQRLDLVLPELEREPAAAGGKSPRAAAAPVAAAPLPASDAAPPAVEPLASLDAPVPVEPPMPAQSSAVEPRVGHEPRRRGRSTALPLALGGGGLALVVAGVVVGQFSSSERDALLRSCGPPDTDGTRTCGSAQADTRRRMESYALIADVLWVSGALIAGTGLSLFLLSDGGGRDAQVSAGCFGGGCGLSAAGHF